MNKILKVIKNPSKILIWASTKGFFNWMNDERFLKLLFKLKMHSKLNFNNVQSFNEKLQWLKINDRKDIYTKMVDKSQVKQYVSQIIGDEYIIPTINVYNKFSEIDFDTLPNQFVMKCTHDSGGLVVCRNKSKLDYKKVRKKINKSLNKNYFYQNREWPYKNVEPKIIIEKYMQDKNDICLKDYKFYCFNGEPKFLYVSHGLENHQTAKIGFFDMNFKEAPFSRSDYAVLKNIQKPKNFNKMKELSSKLAKNTTFLRVDFYEINGKIYFGELTFTPCGGFMPFNPIEWDMKLGKLLILPKINK